MQPIITEYDDFDSIIASHSDEECIERIRRGFRQDGRSPFTFKEINEDVVLKKLLKINIKKSTGHDQLPPKMIKLGATYLSGPIKSIINKSIRTSTFPSELKAAEVTPIFKKTDMLDKANYRPISILPCFSKNVESIYVEQLSCYFESLFAPALSGFGKAHNCQHVLIDFIEKCKNSLDNNNVYGALLTDLSRAFDCLPPKLLISKLNAYGVDAKSCMMLANYFLGRKQRVKLAHTRSDWKGIVKGAPQGSLMGPFTYNVHTNDLLLLIMLICDVFNYADDNTVGCSGENVEDVRKQLEIVSNVMINWFNENMMKVNPDKFQYIVFGKNIKADDVHDINVNNAVIESKSVVKLLGVNNDCALSFNNHISEICTKAGRKLNVLARLSHILNYQTKMLLFNAFIISQFNFCPVVWHYCNIGDMVKMEKIQYRSSKYVYCDFKTSYSQLLIRSNKNIMYVNRLNIILCEIYRCVKKLNPIYLHKLFTLSTNPHNTRGKVKLKQPSFNYVKFGKDKFSCNGAKLWNTLPDNVKIKDNFKDVKAMLHLWGGPQCSCTYCNLCILKQI
jgi:hypothetical protein